jgi:hypothetical protein
MKKKMKAEIHFFRTVVGYRMKEHKHNDDMSEEMGVT